MRSVLFLFAFTLMGFAAVAQGIIRGKITNPVNNQPVGFANVLILGTELGAISDENGNYEIQNVPPVCTTSGRVL